MAHISWLDEDDPNKKRGKVIYEVRDISGERKRKSKTFPPHTPIRTLKAFMREVEQKYDSSETIDYRKRTVNEFMKEYFNSYVSDLSPSTLLNYKRIAYSKDHGISMYLGRLELSSLTITHIQNYVNFLNEEELAPKTIRNYVGVIHAMYDRAMKCRYVERGYNIVGEVDMPKMKKTRLQSYSPDEVKSLLALADNYASTNLRFLIYLAVGTGARRSEMAAIRIKDVDLEKRIWHITQSKIDIGTNDVVKEPKTQAGIRDIPLGETLCKEIRRMIQRYEYNKRVQNESFNDEGFLFSNEFGRPYRTNTLTKWYISFLKSHSEDIRYLPLHWAGRHTYASIAVANGIDIKTLQEILGHADCSVTLNTYSNSFIEQKKAYADNLEKKIFDKD